MRLGSPASAVPDRAAGISELLDTRDVWLGALSAGAILLDGETLVRGCFQALDAGIRARIEAQSPTLTQFTGMVPGVLREHWIRATGRIDRSHRRRSSSSRRVRYRGSITMAWGSARPKIRNMIPMHGSIPRSEERCCTRYSSSLRTRFLGRRGALATPAASEEMAVIAGEVIARWRAEVPPPGDVVLEQEVNELKRAASSFLQMERDALATGDGGTWRYLEYAFGNDERSARYSLTDGSSLAIKGRVDRIDAMDAGWFRVIDYKTGRAVRYRKIAKMGLFNGGRQLQAAIYAGVLQELLTVRSHASNTDFLRSVGRIRLSRTIPVSSRKRVR